MEQAPVLGACSFFKRLDSYCFLEKMDKITPTSATMKRIQPSQEGNAAPRARNKIIRAKTTVLIMFITCCTLFTPFLKELDEKPGQVTSKSYIARRIGEVRLISGIELP
jgi:hypothetical protein